MMVNIDLQVLRTLLDWRTRGEHALLVTVVRTWGSSPRPVGSIMALSRNGKVIGSVSGGCIEDDLIFKFAHANTDVTNQNGNTPVAWQQSPQRLTYGVSADDAHKFGLPCGGTLELVL